MNNKDYIALVIICLIIFFVGLVVGYRIHEMETEGMSIFTYVQESQNFDVR